MSTSPTDPRPSPAPRPSRRGLLGAGAALAAAAAVPGRVPAVATRARAADDQRPDLPGQTPHTRFAMNIEMWWGDRPHVERLHAAADLGFRDVELWGWQGKDLEGLAAAALDRGVSIAQFTAWGFSPGLNDPAHHDDFVRAIDRAVEVAGTLGAPMATVVGGNDQPGMTQAEMHDHIITGLRRVAPIVESAGLMLILEPMNIRVDHKGHCLYGSEPTLAICRAVDSPMVKINWDLYHMQITEGDLIRRMRDGWDQIGYLQLADNPGRMEPGTGEIAYAQVLKAAHELGYDKPVGVECRPSRAEDEAAWALWEADQW